MVPICPFGAFLTMPQSAKLRRTLAKSPICKVCRLQNKAVANNDFSTLLAIANLGVCKTYPSDTVLLYVMLTNYVAGYWFIYKRQTYTIVIVVIVVKHPRYNDKQLACTSKGATLAQRAYQTIRGHDQALAQRATPHLSTEV
jgi:hypothetical protein